MNFLRLLALISILSFINGCSHRSWDHKPIPDEHTNHSPSEPVGPEYPIKDPQKIFTVKIQDTNYNQNQKERLRKAEKAIAYSMNHPDFKIRFLALTPFTSLSGDNAGKSNEQVFQDLFRGAEKLLPAVNYQMDLTVTMYNKVWSTVIGYTQPNILIVYTNKKFHDKMDYCDIAANLFHEWTHKMGYDHKSASDLKSVPYASGYLVGDFCKEHKDDIEQ